MTATSEPTSSASTPAPDSKTSEASTVPTASAATSSTPVAAPASIRGRRTSAASPPAKISAAPSAPACGGMPHGPATTSPGKVAVPAEWVKKAIRRSTIQEPSSPARTASSASSAKASGA